MVFETDSSEAEFKVETSLPKQNDSFGFGEIETNEIQKKLIY